MSLVKVEIRYIANETEARFLGWHGTNLVTYSEFIMKDSDLESMTSWCEDKGYEIVVTTLFPNSPDYIKGSVKSRALENQNTKVW